MARKTKKELRDEYEALAAGVRRHWMKEKGLVLYGKTYTPGQVVDHLGRLGRAQRETSHAYAEWRAAAAREEAIAREMRPFVRGVRDLALAQMIGTPKLAHFGIVVRKPGPKTAAVKAESARKARETRVLHGTMGKGQREKARREARKRRA